MLGNAIRKIATEAGGEESVENSLFGMKSWTKQRISNNVCRLKNRPGVHVIGSHNTELRN
jgi:hypothetical protein